MKSHRLRTNIRNAVIYIVLTVFALVMLFPFFFMFFTSFKDPKDTFRFPPRMLPREPVSTMVEGYGEPLPLYMVENNDQEREFALVESGIKIGVYADPEQPDVTYELPISDVKPTGGFTNQQTVTFEGEEVPLYDVKVDGTTIPMVQLSQTALGRFIDPGDPSVELLQNVRLSEPVEKLTASPENYQEVIELQNMDRSLTNTILVTVLVVYRYARYLRIRRVRFCPSTLSRPGQALCLLLGSHHDTIRRPGYADVPTDGRHRLGR